MSPDEERPIEENEAPSVLEQPIEPAQDASFTKEKFSAQMQRLTERARAAGLSPLRIMAQTYAKQGMAIFDSLLGALENADRTKKRKRE